ncbi:MAG: hypothetical protein ABSG51_04590, partial [Terracidiphilus sp.]
MNVARHRHLSSLLLCGYLVTTLFAQTPGAATAKSTPPPPPAPPNPTAVYPQIVRISYLEGDVRVAPSAEAEKQTGTTWEKAVVNLPVESGYSLATGAGRAEVEFEDASTLYLADNSVLTFDGLLTSGGVPRTQLSLVTGTATLHVRPVSGESFMLRTGTDSLTTAYPNKAYLRITSYTDAIAITPQKDETYQLDAPGSAEQKSAKGQTQFFNDGKSITPPAQADTTDFAAWDSWVAGRVTQRSTAMKAVMKSAGLDVQLPGLAELNGRGTFSACAPYGTCWDPSGNPNQQGASLAPGALQQPNFSLTFAPPSISTNPGVKVTVNLSVAALNGFSGPVDITSSLPNGFICTSCSGQITPGQALALQLMADPTVGDGTYIIPFTATSGALDHRLSLTVYVYANGEPAPDLAVAPAPDDATGFIFPCFPGGVQFLAPPDIKIAKGTYLVSLTPPPYTWVVCHAGSWIYRGNHYVWVVGKRRHHHPPIHWIKDKHKTGYVPIHPRDIKDKPPINRKHDVYALSNKKGDAIERTKFDANSKIQLLKEPPKEFRNAYVPRLEPVSDPTFKARSIANKEPGTALSFNHNSRAWVMTGNGAAGDKSAGESKPFSGRNSNLRTGANNNVVARVNPGGHIGAPPTHISTHA